MDFASVGPRGAGARAQLLLALLLAAVAPFCAVGRPLETHSVKLDLWLSPENPAPTGPPSALHRLSVASPAWAEPIAPLRRLVITADGRILADGVEVDLVGLRRRLDHLATMTDVPWVELRPDPNARYELFAEVFAIFKRAAFERVHLDNARYERAIDD
jgi:biopolymer transport protein ExbD/TolR